MRNIGPVRFHPSHGTAIVLSEGGLVATRSGDFCNGIAFSSDPVRIGQKLCLELTHSLEWSGAIRIGITKYDPSQLQPKDLPRYVCPDLTNKEGFWARDLSENYAETGTRITFYINSLGQIHYFVNNEHKGIFLNNLPTNVPLWALFDIYGNTTSAKFVPADEAPVEILARGPESMRAYRHACESGTQPVFRTRLMLVGQDRVGKTSLKKALTGQRHNSAEISTDGIDLSASCSFNLRDRKAWQLAKREEVNINLDEFSHGEITTRESLEQEYHRAIATNIVQELLFRRKRREEKEQREREEQEKKQKEMKKTKMDTQESQESGTAQIIEKKRKEMSMTGDSMSMLDDLRTSNLLNEMPENVAKLVEEMMEEKEGRNLEISDSQRIGSGKNGKNIVLNIWDFAGQAVYYTTHQVFLSSRAVYVIVFDLSKDLEHGVKGNDESNEFSNLDYMDFWMNSIHAHTAQNTRNSVDNNTLSPPIFIVGTHRNSLDDDPDVQLKMANEKFCQIKTRIKGKPYERHLVTKFFAVENNIDSGEDDHIIQLRRCIEEIASKEPYMGEQIPLKWLKFEQSMAHLVEMDTHFTARHQIQEVARDAGIVTEDELKTLLEFYHDLGVIVHYGHSGSFDHTLRNTVILQPQWLVDMVKKVINSKEKDHQWGVHKESWDKLDSNGILEEKIVDIVWKEYLDQKPALLGLMEKFDLICERQSPKSVSVNERYNRIYYVPSRLGKAENSQKLYNHCDQDVIFYFNFHGFLPDGLFHRLITRVIRWSQESGGHEPLLYFRKAKFFLDSEHDFVLEMGPIHLAFIKVSILRVVDLDESDDESWESSGDKPMPPPKPAACAKVRNFLESSLSELRELWMKRICYNASVKCSCDKPCSLHSKSYCENQECLHFLNLDECLSNKIVCCEHRRIKTSQFRKWFPSPNPIVNTGPVLPDSLVLEPPETLFDGNIEASKGPEMPSWVKSAAKLLNGGSEGQDWTALAKKFGYKKNKIDKFNDDLNPGLALITDWIVSSGNTSLSVDVMMSYLEQLQRDDIIEIIQKGQESEVDPPQVFISYQWDSQDEVNALRDKLEKAGYTCWMDIGQMGGGDQLYARVDEGIRNSKLVISCITPKYVVSHYCNRELSLADLLRKPIIPVMYERISWPPPGGMALMLSQLIYIDMKGVGGHGGSGIHADLKMKYQEIIQRVSCHISPVNPPSIDPPTPRTDMFNKGSHGSVHSSYSSGSLLPNEDPIIPGYDQEYIPTHRRRSHLVENPGTRSERGQSGSLEGVEQVHVTKCAVCTIL